MKFFLCTLLLSSTLLIAANNKIVIKKEFSYDNTQPSAIGEDYAFYKKGQDWIDGLNGLKSFSKCKLLEIDELGKKNGIPTAKLTAKCMER